MGEHPRVSDSGLPQPLNTRSLTYPQVNTRQKGDSPLPEWTLDRGVDAHSKEWRIVRGKTNLTNEGRSA